MSTTKKYLKLKEKAKKFPDKPGVYFFRDKKRKPIYIGRASSLKKRAASYFLKSRDPKIEKMVSEASTITHKTTDTLLEAIILEANLIKKHLPKYNVKDKDNRTFVYLVIPKSDFARPIIIRGRELEKYNPTEAEIYGPYQAYHLLRTALKLVRRIFPYCNRPGLGKPCFYYQIKLCSGACIGAVSKQEYKKNIKNLSLFFRGEKKRLAAKLKRENPEKLVALKHVQDIALLSKADTQLGGAKHIMDRIEGYDASHLAGKEPVGAMVVFEKGEPDTSQYRLFNIKTNGEKEKFDDIASLEQIVRRRLNHDEWTRPAIVFVDGGLAQARAIQRILREGGVRAPVVGLSKGGRHSASSYTSDKFVILGAPKSVREMILASKKLFHQVRDEAHRFAIGHGRRRLRKKFRTHNKRHI